MKTMKDDYGNPSSLHLKGVQAENYIKDASEAVARTLKCNAKEIYFTSGGTESNNLAIIGAAFANRRAGNHIITTGIEHPSVKKAMDYLSGEGFRVTYLSADSSGLVDPKELSQAVTSETILVSVMAVNNEMGACQPIRALSEAAKAKNPNILFHSDAVQAYGKIRLCPDKDGIDLLSVSGHKIHGPKGVGFLYIRDKVKISPITYGGGQQKGMRSGTLNVPGIAGLGAAASEAYEDFEEKMERLISLRQYFCAQVSQIERVVVHGSQEEGVAPHIVNASFCGIRSEVLLHALEDKGIYVSSGSACASHHAADPSTLQNLGLPKNIWESAIRFSFSTRTTEKEIEDTLQALSELVPVLRRYQRH